MHADARVYAGLFAEGEKTAFAIPAGRHVWVHIARGKCRVNGNAVAEGDAVALEDEREVRVEGVDGRGGARLRFALRP